MYKLFSFLRFSLVIVAATLLNPAVSWSADSGYIPEMPLGLDKNEFYVPADNPITKEKVELGRALYFDERLSADNTVSCASCHHPDNGFTDNMPVSTGIKGQQGGRSAPTVINRAFSKAQFWDGRAGSLEDQAKGPPFNPIEMGMESPEALVKKIASIKGYRVWFKSVFSRDINMDDIAKAIATFERTILSGNSRYDQYISESGKMTQKSLIKGEVEYFARFGVEFTESENRGLILFNGKARCIFCHSGANFTDEGYHNLGVGWASGTVDLGRYMVTKDQEDIGAFKTPTLRDISKTGPYMHDGSEKTLKSVVEFYNEGGVSNPFLSGFLEPLHLTVLEKRDLVNFMKTLNGEGCQNVTAPSSFP